MVLCWNLSHNLIFLSNINKIVCIVIVCHLTALPAECHLLFELSVTITWQDVFFLSGFVGRTIFQIIAGPTYLRLPILTMGFQVRLIIIPIMHAFTKLWRISEKLTLVISSWYIQIRFLVKTRKNVILVISYYVINENTVAAA